MGPCHLSENGCLGLVKAEAYLLGLKKTMGREEVNSMNVNYSFKKFDNERRRTWGEAVLRNDPFSKEVIVFVI